MPFLNQPAISSSIITDVSSATAVSLTANTPATVLSAGNRIGSVVKNTGSGSVVVSYGLSSSKKAYDVTLTPGMSYLQDYPEIYPYSASSSVNGSISVVEIL